MVKIVDSRTYVNDKKKVVVVYLKDEFNLEFKGRAKCSPEDTFDAEYGEKLAWLRARKKLLNHHKKEHLQMKTLSTQSYNNYIERMNKELEKFDTALTKVDTQIEDMLNF